MPEHLKSIVMGAFFTLVAVGFAYAVPSAIKVASVVAEVEAVGCPEDDAGDVSESDVEECVPEETKAKNEKEDRGADVDNHGRVVRVVAQCDVKGPAKGRAVSSIAQDPDATEADAEKACEDAKAAAGGSTREGKVNKEQRAKGRPEGAGQPAHAGGASSQGGSAGAGGAGKGARG